MIGGAAIEMLATHLCEIDGADLSLRIIDMQMSLSATDFQAVMKRAAEIMDEPKPPTVAQLLAYVSSSEFKRRCAEVITRQKEGEDLSLSEIADALDIPVELAARWATEAADKMLSRLIVPDNGRLQ